MHEPFISITPATDADLVWIADRQRELFGEHAVPLPVLRDWRDANASVFHLIRAAGERIGEVGVLPVRGDALRQFLDGELREREIPGAALHPPAERALVRDLYLESVVILGDSKAVHDAGVAALLHAFPAIFTALGDEDSLRDLYAAGATSAGNRFLQRLGFERTDAEEERVDHLVMHRTPHAALMRKLGEIP